MVKVVVVDDSAVIREFLREMLDRDPDIAVVGVASNGEEAVEIVARLQPDVVTMDINMPRLNGYDATRRIMESTPTPIVIVSSSYKPQEVAYSMRALEAGAVTILARPAGYGHPSHEADIANLRQTVKLMAEVPVVRRWSKRRGTDNDGSAQRIVPARKDAMARVLAIGASTGGPIVLCNILSALTKPFPMPILVAQHIAPGFSRGLCDWLHTASGLPVHITTMGLIPEAGNVYIAPDAGNIAVDSRGRLSIHVEPDAVGARPSVSRLFASVASYYAHRSINVILSGMGKDGAEELRQLRDVGAFTLAQDKESSIVFGMPGEAVKLDAAVYVGNPTAIAAKINDAVMR